MARAPNAVEILWKITIASVGCTNVTDRRQTTNRETTDGRATAYSEREREFTFAKNGPAVESVLRPGRESMVGKICERGRS